MFHVQFTRLAKAYLDEAKWFKQGYYPTIEEYMNVALLSSGYGMMATNSFVGMGDEATREAFQWVSNDPLIVQASSLIARLCDDMTGHEVRPGFSLFMSYVVNIYLKSLS